MDGEIMEDTMLPEDCRKFYDSMRNGHVPTTSQINMMQFVEFWRGLAENHLPVVHICLGSRISGTYANGLAAIAYLKEQAPDAEIYLVDSTLASVGYGMLALIAADMRDSGKSPAECVDWLNAHKAEINTYYTTSDLTYLYRSGRVGRAGMVIARTLEINPILNLDLEGHLLVQEKVRGRKNTIKRIHEIVAGLVRAPENQTLFICHSDIPEQAHEFGEGLRKEFGFRDVYYTYIGTTIGTHAGPGLMAAFFFGSPRTMKGYRG